MIRRISFHFRNQRALEKSGAVFCAVFTLIACDRKGGSPDWDRPGETNSAAKAQPAAPPAVEERQAEPKAVPNDAPPPATAAPDGNGLRFINYNVKNWLTMDRYIDNKLVGQAPKPAAERDAVIRLLASHSPDIIGLCEIGTAADLAELQESLAVAGLKLPHSHSIGGTDSVRHLGLLSRHPITATARPAESEFQLQGKTYGINRGILDATVEANGAEFRFLGVHFKSKREAEDFDQEEMRVNEARLLRRHVDSILAGDAEARLVVYGDFNDTRPTATIKSVTGSYQSEGYLTAVPCKDSRGDAWTHHWAPHDIYSRIDFVMVTRALRPVVDFQASHIIDDPSWSLASDHRAMVVIFREGN